MGGRRKGTLGPRKVVDLMTNKYPGTCYYCAAPVAVNTGTCWKPRGARRFAVAHLACAGKGEARVVSFYSPVSGESWTRNARGTCEDAPCCGCCS
jgi:hypothetical protein